MSQVNCSKKACERYVDKYDITKLFGGLAVVLCLHHRLQWDSDERLNVLVDECDLRAWQVRYIISSAGGPNHCEWSKAEELIRQCDNLRYAARQITLKWLESEDSLETVGDMTAQEQEK